MRSVALSPLSRALYQRSGAALSVSLGTLNPADKNAGITLSSGDMVATGTSGAQGVRGTSALPITGLFHFRAELVSGTNIMVGIANASMVLNNYPSSGNTNAIGYENSTGRIWRDGVVTTYDTWTDANTVDFWFDGLTGKVWFGLDGTPQAGNPLTGSGAVATINAAVAQYPWLYVEDTASAQLLVSDIVNIARPLT